MQTNILGCIVRESIKLQFPDINEKDMEDKLDLFFLNNPKAEEKLSWYDYTLIKMAAESFLGMEGQTKCKVPLNFYTLDAIAKSIFYQDIWHPIPQERKTIVYNKNNCLLILDELQKIKTLDQAKTLWNKYKETKICNMPNKRLLMSLINYRMMAENQNFFDPFNEVFTDFKTKLDISDRLKAFCED